MNHAQFLSWLFARASPTQTPSPGAVLTSPEVIAAWIAVSGVVLTVIATVVVQLFGRHWTKKDLATQREATKEDLEEQRKQVDKTLAQQREQLDRTLAEQRTRTLNERFATAAGQL